VPWPAQQTASLVELESCGASRRRMLASAALLTGVAAAGSSSSPAGAAEDLDLTITDLVRVQDLSPAAGVKRSTYFKNMLFKELVLPYAWPPMIPACVFALMQQRQCHIGHCHVFMWPPAVLLRGELRFLHCLVPAAPRHFPCKPSCKHADLL
jgi:hypothetical protein